MRDPVYFGQVALCPGGTLAWPDEQDICHDTLYLEASKTS